MERTKELFFYCDASISVCGSQESCEQCKSVNKDIAEERIEEEQVILGRS